VRIGAISASSDRIMPSFELRDVVLHDAQDREALRLSRVVLALSPRSLWSLGFEQLYLEGPQMDVRRSVDGRLWVAGLDVSRGGGDGRAADWFFRQREAVVMGGTLRWTPQPGRHELKLLDPQGRTLQAVRFEVRAAGMVSLKD
jgi:uncharacterized protein YhdP